MKVLITGGTGFVGRAVTAALLSSGQGVKILSRNPPAKSDTAEVEYARADYHDPQSLANAMRDCNAVVHLAALLFASDEAAFTRANVTATENLAKACALTPSPPKVFVYLSSLAAGGPSADPDSPRTENEPENPVSAYGRTKLGGEHELSSLPSATRKVVFRAPIVYGPNDSGVSVIAKWVKAGLMLNPGGGMARFSFIFIDDLAASLSRAVANPKLSGLYYVSEPETYEWRTFILEMAKAMGRKPPFMISVPELPLKIAAYVAEKGAALIGAVPAFNRDKARESLAGHWICSPNKWERDAGPVSWTSLEAGLAKTFGKNPASGGAPGQA